jgi:hypothetical protein
MQIMWMRLFSQSAKF